MKTMRRNVTSKGVVMRNKALRRTQKYLYRVIRILRASHIVLLLKAAFESLHLLRILFIITFSQLSHFQGANANLSHKSFAKAIFLELPNALKEYVLLPVILSAICQQQVIPFLGATIEQIMQN